ncbi:MAG: hypothetical protein AAF663_03335 [Planctomycetota bacterium]
MNSHAKPGRAAVVTAALTIAAGLNHALAQPTVVLDRGIEEQTTPPGYETTVSSIGSLDGASNGRVVLTTENLIPADFITVFLDVERDRAFGGLPGATDILFGDETTRVGQFQRGLGSTQINAGGDVAYGATPNDEDLNAGTTGPDDGVFFRSAAGVDAFLAAEGDSVPASFNLPNGTTFRSLSVSHLADDGTVYVKAEYLTNQTATLVAPGTSRDGQTGPRSDNALLRWDPVGGTVTPVLKTGDTIDFGPDPDQTVLWEGIQFGSGSPTDVSSLSFGEIARDGSGNEAYIAILDVNERANFGTDARINGAHFNNQLIVNGTAARFADGTLIQTKTIVPAAFGGDGTVAATEGIGDTAINTSGQWAATLNLGDPTNPNTGDDPFFTEVVIRDGQLAHQRGDVLDGVTLDGDFRGLALNEDGDFALLHDDTLFFNDQVVAEVGMAIEQGATLASLGNGFTLSDRVQSAGSEQVFIHFLGTDSTDPPTGNANTDLYTLTLTLEAIAGLVGDYNDSGQVEQGDLNLVLNNWGQAAPFEPNGDAFSTPVVDQEELNRVLNNWGSGSVSPDLTGYSVPEPVLGLALAAGTLTIRRQNLPKDLGEPR